MHRNKRCCPPQHANTTLDRSSRRLTPRKALALMTTLGLQHADAVLALHRPRARNAALGAARGSRCVHDSGREPQCQHFSELWRFSPSVAHKARNRRYAIGAIMSHAQTRRPCRIEGKTLRSACSTSLSCANPLSGARSAALKAPPPWPRSQRPRRTKASPQPGRTTRICGAAQPMLARPLALAPPPPATPAAHVVRTHGPHHDMRAAPPSARRRGGIGASRRLPGRAAKGWPRPREESNSEPSDARLPTCTEKNAPTAGRAQISVGRANATQGPRDASRRTARCPEAGRPDSGDHGWSPTQLTKCLLCVFANFCPGPPCPSARESDS